VGTSIVGYYKRPMSLHYSLTRAINFMDVPESKTLEEMIWKIKYANIVAKNA
jgi:hypothetical protein